jgi:TRAP-type mannitol/chloroaromatic compound transport system permease small subunit
MVGIVVVRTLFNINSVGAQELVTYCHAAVVMMASAYTLAEHGHVRVDIFYRRFNRYQQAWIDLLGSILLLLPFAIVTIAVSWNFVADSWAIHETSADAGGIPAVFALKSLLLVYGATLALQAFADIFGQLSVIAAVESGSEPSTEAGNEAASLSTPTTQLLKPEISLLNDPNKAP